MRKFCAALCLVAVSAAAQPGWADPIQAPGVVSTQDPIIPLIDQAIAVTKRRNLDFQVHTPWQILHGLVALRSNYTVMNGDEVVNALDFISTKAKFKGDRWFERTAIGGRAHPYNGTPYDFEGHVNQTLAILAMCDLPLTHQFVLEDGSTVTMADMVRDAQWTVSARDETTWTLWLLTHYLDQDATWTNSQGQRWSMEHLVRIQTAASPYNAPCGGCHGLFALAYARNAYLQKNGKLQGSWLEADQKLQQYIAVTKAMQNQDGSFATGFFKSRGFSYDFNERINSSGHMLEWLMVALPRKRLDEQWLRLGVQTLANDLIRNASQPADCGPLYHSLHALILYRQRITPDESPAPKEEVAVKSGSDAGPLRTSEPSGESMPLSAQQQKQMQATVEAIVGKPSITAQGDAKTLTPGTPPQSGNTAAKETEKSAKGNSLKPAETTQAPVLLTPPMVITPALKPLKVAEEPTLKKLSGEQSEDDKTESADVKVEEQQLSPVTGGMPILKPADATSNEKDSKKDSSAKAADDQPAENAETDEDQSASKNDEKELKSAKDSSESKEPKATSENTAETQTDDAEVDDAEKVEQKVTEATAAAQNVVDSASRREKRKAARREASDR